MLVVRGDNVAAAAEIVDVPNADHRQQYRHILIQRRVVEVLIHQVSAVEHFDEVFFTQIQHNRQADGRPQAVTSAYPIPEFKHMRGVDAKLGHCFFVGGNRDKVLGDVFFVALAQEPLARRIGIGERFLSGKGFRSDDEQRGFRMHFIQRVA